VDLSKEYIKMCDCPEIQDEWEPTRGDNYILGDAMPNNKHFAVIVLGCCWEKCSGCRYEVEDLKAECIWLPRQDQLQEMVWKGEDVTPWVKIGLLYNFLNWKSPHREYDKEMKHFDYISTVKSSMEQLWLAFVMWELHSKQWLTMEENGSAWKGEKQ